MIRKSPTILLVEDDPENRSAMAKILRGGTVPIVDVKVAEFPDCDFQAAFLQGTRRERERMLFQGERRRA